MKDFETVIIGSTYYSAGYAKEAKNCLICERTQLSDPIYYGALHFPTVSFSSDWCEETKLLYRYFEENKGINNGIFDPILSEILLSSFIANNNITLLLGTDVTEISENKITLINNGGIEQLHTGKIIDKRLKAQKNKLNILCRGNFDSISLIESPDFTITISDIGKEKTKLLTFSSKENLELNIFKMKATHYLCEIFEGKDLKILRSAYLSHSDSVLPSPFDEFDKGIKNAKEAKG